MWLQEPDHTSFCDVYRSVVCSVTHVLVEILKGLVCVYSSESECVCVCVCVCADHAWWPAFLMTSTSVPFLSGWGRRPRLSRRLHLLVTTATVYPRLLQLSNRLVLVLAHSVLPPVEELESGERPGAAAKRLLIFLHADRGGCGEGRRKSGGGWQGGVGGGGRRAEFLIICFYI